MAITQETHWDNVGIEPGAGDAEYTAGQQPISEHDNWFNWSAAKDVENLIAALENVTTGHDHDGANSKAVDGSDVINTPAGDIAATNVQAAINELDTEKETPAAAQTKVDTHAADTSTHGVAEVADKATVTAEIDSDIATHEADTSVHGVAEVADVTIISALIDARIATHAAVTTNVHGTGAGNDVVGDDELSEYRKIKCGTFTGNNGTNTAIAHGGGAEPKTVLLGYHEGVSHGICINTNGDEFLSIAQNDSIFNELVTMWDATNFYVSGNSNANGFVYSYTVIF